MKIEKIDNITIGDCYPVTLTKTGNIYCMRFMAANVNSHIKKLDKDNYLDLFTGEVREYNHQKLTRAENIESTRKTFKRLRNLINTNVTNPNRCLFITLTYKENMKDIKRLYDDFRKFNMRFTTYCKRKKFPTYEYISIIEPQGRGAWHCHVIYIFSKKAPFIPNADVAAVWKNGFTSTRAIKGNVDNVGAYLTAYLTDMPIEDLTDLSLLNGVCSDDIKTIEIIDEKGNKSNKSYIKGLRLKMYPKGSNIYRHSKGIIQPQIIECSKAEAMKIIGSATKTFEKTIQLTDAAGEILNKINYQYFNKAKIRVDNQREV